MTKKKRGDIATRWKPGQSGNPKGRPSLRDDLKDYKMLTKVEASALVQKIMDMTSEQMKEMLADPETPAMEIMVARIVSEAINQGDPQRLNFLFDRTVGKVIEKREVEITPVTYKTQVRGDGALVREVLEEDKDGE